MIKLIKFFINDWREADKKEKRLNKDYKKLVERGYYEI